MLFRVLVKFVEPILLATIRFPLVPNSRCLVLGMRGSVGNTTSTRYKTKLYYISECKTYLPSYFYEVELSLNSTFVRGFFLVLFLCKIFLSNEMRL